MSKLDKALGLCEDFATIDYLGMTIEMDFTRDDGVEVKAVDTVNGMWAYVAKLIREGIDALESETPQKTPYKHQRLPTPSSPGLF